MRRGLLVFGAVCIAIFGAITCTQERKEEIPTEPGVTEKLKQYAPVQIAVPWELLPETERKTLAKLYQAAHIMDELFLRQVSAGKPGSGSIHRTGRASRATSPSSDVRQTED